jgi:hypothetical protein
VNPIFASWLRAQHEEAAALARASDALEVRAVDAQRWILEFSCTGLVHEHGEVREHDHFVVGVRFPDDYQSYVRPPEILTWIAPRTFWHPNVRPPFACIGDIAPNTPLVEIVHRLYELIVFDNVTMDERNALNPAACAWARRNRALFPLDPRPLRRARRQAAELGA